MAHISNLGPEESETGESLEITMNLLQSEFQASPGYRIRPSQKVSSGIDSRRL